MWTAITNGCTLPVGVASACAGVTLAFDIGGVMPVDGPRDGLPIEWIDVPDDPSQAPYPTSRSAVRRAPSQRRQFIFLLSAAAIAFAATATWYATRHVHKPALVVTLAGRPVDNAAAVIGHADAELAAFARTHHGTLSARSRCYFDRVGGHANTDVGEHLFCGPVLFHGGTSTAPYLRYLVAPDSDTTATRPIDLAAATTPDSTTPAALPPGAHLVRPDRRSPPPGADGLIPPPPAPAPDNVMAWMASADAPNLQAMPTTAIIGSLNIEVHLEASGQIASYGRGMDALSAPPGQTLHAFRLRLLGGEAVEPADAPPLLGLSIDGGALRPIPQNVDANSNGDPNGVSRVLVAAMPNTTRTVELVVTDAGITQRMSLLTGVIAPGNIRVLQRPYASRLAKPSPPVSIRATITGAGATRTTQLTVQLDNASLDYFAPYGSGRASGPTRALLSVAICLRSPDLIGQDNAAGACRPYDSADFSVTPTDEQPVRAHLYPGGFTAVDVPATFTTGTLTIRGSESLGDGTTLNLQPCTLRIAFPD